MFYVVYQFTHCLNLGFVERFYNKPLARETKRLLSCFETLNKAILIDFLTEFAPKY